MCVCVCVCVCVFMFKRNSSQCLSCCVLNSIPDGESTALGPETTTPVDKPPSKATQHTTPVPAKSEKGSESETEQLHFPPITPQSGTLTPYESPHTPTGLCVVCC